MNKPNRRKFRQETVIHSYIVRPLAQELVLLIWNTNITPNQLTLIRSIISIVSLYFFTVGESYFFILGIVMFQVSEVIDHADGMLARMKSMTSNLGQYYEYVTDELFSTEHGALGFSIGIGSYIYSGDAIFLLLPVVLIFVYYYTQYIRLKVNIEDQDIVMEINHDKDSMLNIFILPISLSMTNIFKTILTWRNQLLFIGVIFLIYDNKIPLILTFILFIVFNFYMLIKQLKIGYKRNV